MAKVPAVRKWLAPSVPVILELTDDQGNKEALSFRLSFDFNALALVEGLTGLSLLTGDIFDHPSATNLSAMFWAAAQAHQPDYAGPEGLAAIRSYLSLANLKVAREAVEAAFFASLSREKQEEITAAVAKAQEEAAAAVAEGREVPLAGTAEPAKA